MSALSLSLAKAHLNITVPTYDTEIQAVIDAAESILANSVGPLTTLSARTDRVAGGWKLVLPLAPVVSVTSITSTDGATADLSSLTINLAAGVIYYSDNVTRFWQGVYDVAYIPGRATVPADLLLAIKKMVAHLWKDQQGGGTRPGTGLDTQQAPGYLMPYPVQELIEPYRLVNVGAA
jgi:hypothetical protein